MPGEGGEGGVRMERGGTRGRYDCMNRARMQRVHACVSAQCVIKGSAFSFLRLLHAQAAAAAQHILCACYENSRDATRHAAASARRELSADAARQSPVFSAGHCGQSARMRAAAQCAQPRERQQMEEVYIW